MKATELTELDFLEDAWRFNVSTHAETASQGRWIAYRWLDYVLEQTQTRIASGNSRFLILAPPRHGKSECFSHRLPSWFLSWFPRKNVVLGSYSDTFAARWGLKVRDTFTRNPDLCVKVRQDKSLISDWLTTDGGGMRSVGVGGSITGLGGHLLILDDPHKNWEEATSPTYQRKAREWFDAVFYTRLEPNGSIVVIMTRWDENDLAGYLINDHTDDWTTIRLPALAEDEDILGREPGEALCPERFDVEQLEKIKRAIGSHMFAGLYQQRPAPLEGGLIKRDWFRRWTDLPSFDQVLQSWDLTFKANGTSFVVGQVWARSGANYYLIDQVRERVGFTEQVRLIKTMTARHADAVEKLIEEAANGHAVLDALKNEVSGVIGIKPKGSKEARLAAVSGLIESGNVYIPGDASWADDFVEEVSTFPNAANDDQVDAMTMGLTRLHKHAANFDFSLPNTGVRSNPWDFASAIAT